jgi:hypothetical protein
LINSVSSLLQTTSRSCPDPSPLTRKGGRTKKTVHFHHLHKKNRPDLQEIRPEKERRDEELLLLMQKMRQNTHQFLFFKNTRLSRLIQQ